MAFNQVFTCPTQSPLKRWLFSQSSPDTVLCFLWTCSQVGPSISIALAASPWLMTLKGPSLSPLNTSLTHPVFFFLFSACQQSQHLMLNTSKASKGKLFLFILLPLCAPAMPSPFLKQRTGYPAVQGSKPGIVLFSPLPSASPVILNFISTCLFSLSLLPGQDIISQPGYGSGLLTGFPASALNPQQPISRLEAKGILRSLLWLPTAQRKKARPWVSFRLLPTSPPPSCFLFFAYSASVTLASFWVFGLSNLFSTPEPVILAWNDFPLLLPKLASAHPLSVSLNVHSIERSFLTPFMKRTLCYSPLQPLATLIMDFIIFSFSPPIAISSSRAKAHLPCSLLCHQHPAQCLTHFWINKSRVKG